MTEFAEPKPGHLEMLLAESADPIKLFGALKAAFEAPLTDDDWELVKDGLRSPVTEKARPKSYGDYLKQWGQGLRVHGLDRLEIDGSGDAQLGAGVEALVEFVEKFPSLKPCKSLSERLDTVAAVLEHREVLAELAGRNFKKQVHAMMPDSQVRQAILAITKGGDHGVAMTKIAGDLLAQYEQAADSMVSKNSVLFAGEQKGR